MKAVGPPAWRSTGTSGQMKTRTSGTRTNHVQTRDVGRRAPSTAIGGVSARTAEKYNATLVQVSSGDGAIVSPSVNSQVSQTRPIHGAAGSRAVLRIPWWSRHKTGNRLTSPAPANRLNQAFST